MIFLVESSDTDMDVSSRILIYRHGCSSCSGMISLLINNFIETLTILLHADNKRKLFYFWTKLAGNFCPVLPYMEVDVSIQSCSTFLSNGRFWTFSIQVFLKLLFSFLIHWNLLEGICLLEFASHKFLVSYSCTETFCLELFSQKWLNGKYYL